MVEQFLKLKATEMWGLGNRNVGFGQPKCGVWATEMWGLGNRNVGFGQPKCGVSALGEFFEKQPKCGVYILGKC